jgi:hypothetical protein
VRRPASPGCGCVGWRLTEPPSGFTLLRHNIYIYIYLCITLGRSRGLRRLERMLLIRGIRGISDERLPPPNTHIVCQAQHLNRRPEPPPPQFGVGRGPAPLNWRGQHLSGSSRWDRLEHGPRPSLPLRAHALLAAHAGACRHPARRRIGRQSRPRHPARPVSSCHDLSPRPAQPTGASMRPRRAGLTGPPRPALAARLAATAGPAGRPLRSFAAAGRRSLRRGRGRGGRALVAFGQAGARAAGRQEGAAARRHGKVTAAARHSHGGGTAGWSPSGNDSKKKRVTAAGDGNGRGS